MINTRFVSRVRWVTVLCTICAIVIVGRLYVLQVLHSDLYIARADAQYSAPSSPLLDRNNIFFSDKDGTLIAAATMQTVGTSTERKRFYPGGSLAAEELGFVAYNNDDTLKGRYGLERYYEQTLARPKDDVYSNFFVELFGAAKSILGGDEVQSGSIVTTIEPGVQTELERTLTTYESQWHPAQAGGIIMDPKTGEIIAMAVSPTFDLNNFKQEKNPAVFGNPMVQNVYEMGSIMKPLTVAAGLDSGAITPETTYNDTGCLQVEDKKICNFDAKARGVIPIQQILSQSLNLGASFIATKMGPDVMRDYFLNHYKLGEETGIDLPSEIHGLVSNIKESNRAIEYDTASFGQGIAVTPIETARALATIANGGKLVTPHLVRSIRYDSGLSRTLTWDIDTPVLKEETATVVSRMLTKVVDESLANGTIKIDHYSVAAKTGTAQIANPAGGGYYEDRFLHSFFGYFPSFDAKFLIFLFALEPQGAPFASQTLAPPFHSLTQFLISYYDVPPDR